MMNANQLSYNEINSLYSVERILLECGARKLVDTGEYFSFSSPFREDKNPSMVMYKNDLFCIDFAAKYSAPLHKFVKDCTGTNLNDLIGISNEEVLNRKYWGGGQKIRIGNFSKHLDLDDYKVTCYDGEILYDFSKCEAAREYVESRFLTKEYRDFFGIGYIKYCRLYRSPKVSMTKEKLKGTVFDQRIYFPIKMGGTVVALEGRDWTRRRKKKCIYSKGSTTHYLFNYDNLDKTKPLVLVEGTMDTPRIWSHITKNVSCLFGNRLKFEQKEQIKEFPELILLVDMDEGGRTMISEVEQYYEEEFWIAQLPTGDPGDPCNSISDLQSALDHRISSTEYLLKESELFEDTKITSSSFFGKD